ncbi:MAG: Na+/H+ antiporter subunit E [Bacteroidetes bacterium]|jgi:multicomponent Na+:H+ antiporter subunit E|nr:Na+/H+ antiporter subunit E [Bacteroidota bacterium]
MKRKENRVIGRTKRFLKRLVGIVQFVIFYIIELVVSSSILAYDIMRPRKSFQHGIVAVDIDMKSDTELLALINFVSMTPGSLVVDLSKDKKTLFIHTMYLDDVEEFKKNFKHDFQRRIEKVFQ